MVELLLGNDVEIATMAEWSALARAGKPVVFERVVIVDRCAFPSCSTYDWRSPSKTDPEPCSPLLVAAHRHPLTGRWNKMNSAIASLAADDVDWFAPYRLNAHRSLSLPVQEPGDQERPVIVYFDRNRPVRRAQARPPLSLAH